MRGQRRGARTERRAGALAHDACRKRERRGTGWDPQWKAVVCRSKHGRLLRRSTLGPSGQRAKLSGPQRYRLSFAQARRYFSRRPLRLLLGRLPERGDVSGTFCARARCGGRGLEGGELSQVGEGRPRKGLGFAGYVFSRRPAVDASGDLSGEEGKPLSAKILD